MRKPVDRSCARIPHGRAGVLTRRHRPAHPRGRRRHVRPDEELLVRRLGAGARVIVHRLADLPSSPEAEGRAHQKPCGRLST